MTSLAIQIGLQDGGPAALVAGLPVSTRAPARPLSLPEGDVRLERLLRLATASHPWRKKSAARTAAETSQSEADAADRADVEATLAGDGDAYGRLVHRYQQPIAEYLWRFSRDRQCWEELVQEVFVEAYFSLPTYRAEAPLLHWLRKIATRVGLHWWKERQRRRREAPLELRPSDVASGQQFETISAREAAEVVHALLSRVSPRDRLVLTLLHLEECSVAEIAELTGWSRSMVKVQAHRARKRFKTLLEHVWP